MTSYWRTHLLPLFEGTLSDVIVAKGNVGRLNLPLAG